MQRLLQANNMNSQIPPLPSLQDGDTCLYHTNGIVGRVISWREDDYLGIDHVAKYIRGKLFSSLSKQGICFYDFTTINLVMLLRPLTFDLAKFDAWAPTVIGAPYGWGDIKADAGFKDVAHVGVPDGGIIHQTGADCSDTCAMADEVAGCPQFKPSFDKRRVTPFHFTMSIGNVEQWRIG